MEETMWMGGGGKSYSAWKDTAQWCKDNPEKIAAIITPDGVFTITYRGHKPLIGVDRSFDTISAPHAG